MFSNRDNELCVKPVGKNAIIFTDNTPVLGGNKIFSNLVFSQIQPTNQTKRSALLHPRFCTKRAL